MHSNGCWVDAVGVREKCNMCATGFAHVRALNRQLHANPFYSGTPVSLSPNP